ncbi:hypothetical protein GS415_09755 [Rhodococcus hoagii]|nr:hypothetical protein [Prescottella equi]
MRARVPPSDTASGAPLRDSSPNRRQSPQECRTRPQGYKPPTESAPNAYTAILDAQNGRCYICQRATGAARRLAVDHDHTCCPAGGSCGQCVRAPSAAPATGSSATSATTPTHSTAPSPSSATGPPQASSTHSTPRTTNEPEPEPHRRSHPTCRRVKPEERRRYGSVGRCALTSPDEQGTAGSRSGEPRPRQARTAQGGGLRRRKRHGVDQRAQQRRTRTHRRAAGGASNHRPRPRRSRAGTRRPDGVHPKPEHEYAEGMNQAGDEIIALLDGRP